MASLVSAPASLARLARPIHGEHELEQLVDLVAEARIVLLGSASYGTHEHYDLRASVTRKLIAERGFAAVVVEADWPDALRVDRYVRNQSDDDDAGVALTAFDHFPGWAWRNDDVARFIEWLRTHNYYRRAADRIGFYGLDLFSMNAAMRAMKTHLDVSDDDLVAELCDMQWRHAARSGRAPSGEAWLHAMQRATASDAMAYYRTLLAGGDASSSLRSVQLADTVDMLARELGKPDEPAKLVVWAHDAHVGDARAMASEQVSLGQQLRERHDDATALVGFTTFEGTVMTATEWGEVPSVEPLPPSQPASWEALFHATGMSRFMISASALRRVLHGDERLSRPHRTIGAVITADPYCETRLAECYDLIVHVDATRSVEPIAADPSGETHAMRDVGLHA